MLQQPVTKWCLQPTLWYLLKRFGLKRNIHGWFLEKLVNAEIILQDQKIYLTKLRKLKLNLKENRASDIPTNGTSKSQKP